MKTLFIASLLALLAAGCASPERLVLDPVGPAPVPLSGARSDGALLVFSAFDPQAHFDGYAYRRYYSDYKILSDDGRLVQRVHNDNGVLAEGPREVTLAPGAYRVIARASGHRAVTVPVVIAPRHVTTVHLD